MGLHYELGVLQKSLFPKGGNLLDLLVKFCLDSGSIVRFKGLVLEVDIYPILCFQSRWVALVTCMSSVPMHTSSALRALQYNIWDIFNIEGVGGSLLGKVIRVATEKGSTHLRPF